METITERGGWQSVPWCCANHGLHPAEPHWCRCRCLTATVRDCPEHGERAFAPAEQITARLAEVGG